jgi:hypothetical protein
MRHLLTCQALPPAPQIRCIRGAERCTIRYAPHSGPARKSPPAKKGRRLESEHTGTSHMLHVQSRTV